MKSATHIAAASTFVFGLMTTAKIEIQATVIWIYSGAYVVTQTALAGAAIGFPIKRHLDKYFVLKQELL